MDVPLPVLASYFVVREFQIPLPLGPPVQLLTPNSNRWALLFCSLGGTTIGLMRNANLASPGSLTLANAANASNQFVLLTFRDVGPVVQDQWFGVAVGVAGTIGIQEIVYQPPGGA